MTHRCASRPKPRFHPQLEQSEPRVLLSTGGLVHDAVPVSGEIKSPRESLDSFPSSPSSTGRPDREIKSPDFFIDGFHRATYYLRVYAHDNDSNVMVYGAFFTNYMPQSVHISIDPRVNVRGKALKAEAFARFDDGLAPGGELFLWTDDKRAVFNFSMHTKDGKFHITHSLRASSFTATPSQQFKLPEDNPYNTFTENEDIWKMATSTRQALPIGIIDEPMANRGEVPVGFALILSR